ncbi:hypothetical protein PVAP13_6NG017500 [Panicum virgatum]|uniref:Uncharacterized protein n=1 Tax=Panicum virgatum TaxID=38727 RepID=A0A8T0QTC6_PANVG|nr:hypothetical protein PVAP13_6NG017500 [Panicum virgatum]
MGDEWVSARPPPAQPLSPQGPSRRTARRPRHPRAPSLPPPPPPLLLPARRLLLPLTRSWRLEQHRLDEPGLGRRSGSTAHRSFSVLQIPAAVGQLGRRLALDGEAGGRQPAQVFRLGHTQQSRRRRRTTAMRGRAWRGRRRRAVGSGARTTAVHGCARRGRRRSQWRGGGATRTSGLASGGRARRAGSGERGRARGDGRPSLVPAAASSVPATASTAGLPGQRRHGQRKDSGGDR